MLRSCYLLHCSHVYRLVFLVDSSDLLHSGYHSFTHLPSHFFLPCIFLPPGHFPDLVPVGGFIWPISTRTLLNTLQLHTLHTPTIYLYRTPIPHHATTTSCITPFHFQYLPSYHIPPFHFCGTYLPAGHLLPHFFSLPGTCLPAATACYYHFLPGLPTLFYSYISFTTTLGLPVYISYHLHLQLQIPPTTTYHVGISGFSSYNFITTGS